MEWGSSVSVSPKSDENIQNCIDGIRRQLKEPPDLALLFVSPHFQKEYPRIGAVIYKELSCKVLLGCSAGGVIGAGKEVEEMPGFSLTAGSLPDVQIHPFRIEQKDLPTLDGSPRLWESLFRVTSREEPHFMLLGDPFSFSPEEWLNGLDFAFPRAAKVGGLASGAVEPGKNALFLNGECIRSGLIGVALSGDIMMDTVVAQGCYPIGPVLQVTDCENNLLKELNGRLPLEVVADVLSSLCPEEQEQVQNSLFLGVVMDTMKENYCHGDFLIRNLLGADSEEGHLLVAAQLHEGQAVQFHLRDARASSSDLDEVLSAFAESRKGVHFGGAFLFSCLGRGQSLYGHSNHDSERLQHYLGNLPLGGFFCNGEIGPVGGRTYLHGYTSSFVFFRPRA